MRIIAGERRGWRLESPKGADVTRPISDRVKENLFNIIQGQVPASVALDLFAGTGSVGLEALSRGARWVTFVEQDREAARILQRNVARLGYEAASRVITGDALRLRPGIRDTGLRDPPGPLTFDLVFVDPPYRMMADDLMRAVIGESLATLASYGAIAEDATIVVRRESRLKLQYQWPGLEPTRSRPYGSMALDFLRHAGQPSAEGTDDG